MLANAMNSHDTDFLQSFMDRYTVPHVRMSKQCSSICPEEAQQASQQPQMRRIEVRGAVRIARYWSLLLNASADSIVTVRDTQIISRRDTTASTITCTFKVQFTRLHSCGAMFPVLLAQLLQDGSDDEHDLPQAGSKRSHNGSNSSSKSSNSHDNSSGNSGVPNMNSQHWDVKETLRSITETQPTLEKPMAVEVHGMLTFEVNASRQIELLDFGQPVVVF